MRDGLAELLADIVAAAEKQGKTKPRLSPKPYWSVLTVACQAGWDMRVSTLDKLAKVVGLRLTLGPDVPIAVKIQKGILFK